MKAVQLGAPGERPVWGQRGATTAIDADILAAKDGPLEQQRRLFYVRAAPVR
jgi:hypothetical protein